MVVLHLATSPFFGGPERQMLGDALNQPETLRTVFVLFTDKGKSAEFQCQLHAHGFETVVLMRDTPHFAAMVRELGRRLRDLGADLLCCHGYKADLVGLPAARRAAVPVIAISGGWTAATWKVRVYEALDRACLRRMDRVVCVSEGQAGRVRRAGVRPDRVVVIRNAVQADRFDQNDPTDRGRLEAMFPQALKRIVGSAGRLSPEKGFGVLVEAAAIVTRSDSGIGFIHFGDGPLREAVARRIAEFGLEGRFVLAGFRSDMDRFIPHWDVAVLPSFTEGLPNVVLEAFAAGVPVVATAVGGTPEIVQDRSNGYLVPAGDAEALARRIRDVLQSEEDRRSMGQRGRERVLNEFTFEAKCKQYQKLWAGLLNPLVAT